MRNVTAAIMALVAAGSGVMTGAAIQAGRDAPVLKEAAAQLRQDVDTFKEARELRSRHEAMIASRDEAIEYWRAQAGQ